MCVCVCVCAWTVCILHIGVPHERPTPTLGEVQCLYVSFSVPTVSGDVRWGRNMLSRVTGGSLTEIDLQKGLLHAVSLNSVRLCSVMS